MILRRYFATHAVETLKTKRLMVSSPLVFEDVNDCLINFRPINNDNWREFYQAFCRRTGQPCIILNENQRDCLIEGMNNCLRSIREKMVYLYRICCFEDPSDSDVASEIKMWNEYTENRGIRISFEIDTCYQPGNRYWMEKIKYVNSLDEIPQLDVTSDLSSQDAERIMSNIVSYKLSQYQFEHEYRLIAPTCV